ncbi:hypothetical protein ACFXA3_22425, partial [Streptomyces sp. NPDC059456]
PPPGAPGDRGGGPTGSGAPACTVEEHLDDPGVVSLIACISGLPLEADGEGRARVSEDTDSPAQWWHLDPAGPDA